MSGGSLGQKRPFATTINEFVDTSIANALAQQGKVLPCTVTAVNGAIVTVNFEVLPNANTTIPPVTCPIAESTYVRLPVQVGDLGICVAANTRLGGITGLGTGQASLNEPSNLGGLVFVPVGNKNWSEVDPNAVNINAPNGAVIRDTNNQCTITLVPSGVTIVRGNTRVIINDSGITMYGNLTVHGHISGDNGFSITGGTGATMQITGDINQIGSFANSGTLTNAGKDVGSTHRHSGVQTGSGDTGTPV